MTSRHFVPAAGLGAYRDCRYTCECYPYDSLPPLDSTRYTGAFEWLGGTGEPVPEQVAHIEGLAARPAAEGIALPADFAAFHTSGKVRYAPDEVSVTCCWTDISDPLPSPVEPGAFLVRFLRDQQDCVIWYLYLRPSGEAFVVHSYVDYEFAVRGTARRRGIRLRPRRLGGTAGRSCGARRRSRSSRIASGWRTASGSRSAMTNCRASMPS
ncbi:hypothetical protein [Streptomyces sp. NPDC001070]